MAAFDGFPNLKLIASTARHIADADRHRISARIERATGADQTDEMVVAGIVAGSVPVTPSRPACFMAY